MGFGETKNYASTAPATLSESSQNGIPDHSPQTSLHQIVSILVSGIANQSLTQAGNYSVIKDASFPFILHNQFISISCLLYLQGTY